MKVLEKGREQKGWSATTTCTGKGNGDGGCGAKLLVEASDLYITQSHARDETESYVTFRCVECDVLTDLAKPSGAAWQAANANGYLSPDGTISKRIPGGR